MRRIMPTGKKMRRMSYARLSKAVSTVQLIIVIAIVMVAAGGVFFFTRTRDSTPPVAVLRANSTEVEDK